MRKQKIRQHQHRKGRRNAQNLRTFNNIQRRRAKHAKNHGVTIESLGSVRFTTVPTANK